MTISIRYIPVILTGIVVIVGLNVFAAVRDSRAFKQLEEKNPLEGTPIQLNRVQQDAQPQYQQLQVIPFIN